jgi:DNA helicase INO80
LIVQVCNHPELFERADVSAPFSFCHFNLSFNLIREGDALTVPYATSSALRYNLPKTVFRESAVLATESTSISRSDTAYLHRLMNIWTDDRVQKSLDRNGAVFLSHS